MSLSLLPTGARISPLLLLFSLHLFISAGSVSCQSGTTTTVTDDSTSCDLTCIALAVILPCIIFFIAFIIYTFSRCLRLTSSVPQLQRRLRLARERNYQCVIEKLPQSNNTANHHRSLDTKSSSPSPAVDPSQFRHPDGELNFEPFMPPLSGSNNTDFLMSGFFTNDDQELSFMMSRMSRCDAPPANSKMNLFFPVYLNPGSGSGKSSSAKSPYASASNPINQAKRCIYFQGEGVDSGSRRWRLYGLINSQFYLHLFVDLSGNRQFSWDHTPIWEYHGYLTCESPPSCRGYWVSQSRRSGQFGEFKFFFLPGSSSMAALEQRIRWWKNLDFRPSGPNKQITSGNESSNSSAAAAVSELWSNTHSHFLSKALDGCFGCQQAPARARNRCGHQILCTHCWNAIQAREQQRETRKSTGSALESVARCFVCHESLSAQPLNDAEAKSFRFGSRVHSDSNALLSPGAAGPGRSIVGGHHRVFTEVDSKENPLISMMLDSHAHSNSNSNSIMNPQGHMPIEQGINGGAGSVTGGLGFLMDRSSVQVSGSGSGAHFIEMGHMNHPGSGNAAPSELQSIAVQWTPNLRGSVMIAEGNEPDEFKSYR